MAKWKKVKLGDVAELYDASRVPLSGMERKKRKGCYPYYGAQGIIDYINDYLFDGRYIIVAEDGENLKSRQLPIANLATGKFWLNNHAHILKNNELSNLLFLYYWLNSIDYSAYITGSAQPKLNQENLIKIEIDLPDLVTQKKIAGILSSLDDKIELNNRINGNLAA
jgi:type I restriction enzyme, S subunit